MSQSTQSTPSTPTSVPQWDPIETLNINRRPDGNFTCSGVKNGTTKPCSYPISRETTSRISDLLDDISVLPPQSTIQSLRNLADVTLCHHHETQAEGKVTEWTAAINRLPSTPQTSNGTVEEDIRLLRDEIMLLTARIASLEVGRGEAMNAASPRQVPSPLSARLGLRLSLFGRNNNWILRYNLMEIKGRKFDM